MKLYRAHLFVILVALSAAGCGHTEQQQQTNTTVQAASAPIAEADTGVRSITMPHDEPELPPGVGREAFVASCVVCHSPRYITNQPPFSRKMWTEETDKMIKTYGAHVTDEQAKQIVDYLVQINGKADEGH